VQLGAHIRHNKVQVMTWIRHDKVQIIGGFIGGFDV
jgi:hypothetical protein